MKSPIPIFLFLAMATTIHAQNHRVERFSGGRTEIYNFQKGGDSVHFSIRGKRDTLSTVTFHRNGRIESATWKNDSFHDFDALGRLKEKRYGRKKGRFGYENSTTFYANGQVKKRINRDKKGFLEQFYAKNGNLTQTEQINYYRFGSYSQIRNGQGQPVSSVREDTLEPNKKRAFAEENSPIVKHDTLFFANGRPFKTKIMDDFEGNLGGFYFNADGSIAQKIMPDSLKLVAFKDNVDCYYGLKNKRGDTIIPPKYDHIYDEEDNFWLAFSGNNLTLFKQNGAPMPIFAPNLASISTMRSISSKEEFEISSENGFDETIEEPIPVDFDVKKYLTKVYNYFTADGKYGVVTAEGKILRTPQYFPISRQSIDGERLIQFEEKNKATLISRMGYLDKAGKPIFDERFKSVIYAHNKDYFFLSEQAVNKKNSYHERGRERLEPSIFAETFNEENARFGLGSGENKVLLAPNFNGILSIESTPLFVTTIEKPNENYKKSKNSSRNDENEEGQTEIDNQEFITHQGLFNAETGRWLVDSVGFRVTKYEHSTSNYFEVENIAEKKYGVMDSTGKYLVPLNYDDIKKANDAELYGLQKGETHQFCTIDGGKIHLRPTEYEYLERLDFDKQYADVVEPVYYFLAKKNGKWGIIDTCEKQIMPFEYDYATQDYPRSGFILVKNDQAYCFMLNSLPYPVPSFPHVQGIFNEEKKLGSYRVVGTENQSFYINDTGKVVLSPDYKTINWSNGEYEVAQNSAKQRKLIFLKTGQVIDYPFSYSIQFANHRSRVLIVKDKAEIGYGVASTDGKLLVPCVNYGVAIGDVATSTFFVKRDTPFIIRFDQNGRKLPMNIETNQITVEDSQWQMYDGDGKLLDKEPFRFPIAFKNGVGIGMKGDTFNLYKTDGSIVKPFSKPENASKTAQKPIYTEGSSSGFKNILREPILGFYTLFYSQGLTPKAILTRNNGQILVESGRYDGISKFYGKFALVSNGNKIGMIDTFGREIIAPQDLRISSARFMDSLDLFNKMLREAVVPKGKNYYVQRIELPIKIERDNNTKYVHPDSLNITATQRAALWNLLLEQWTTVKTATDSEILRVTHKANAYFFSQYGSEYRTEAKTPTRVAVGDSTTSFILTTQPYNYRNKPVFYNFYRRQGRWEDLKINDLLNIQGENRWKMNDLLTRKIKLLKDKQIDCSNTAAFITTAENRWMLTQTGIDFCFVSSENSTELVILAFTWAELSPFLKFRIY